MFYVPFYQLLDELFLSTLGASGGHLDSLVNLDLHCLIYTWNQNRQILNETKCHGHAAQ